ncbi:FUSC family protein [Arthrobacter sp. HY1533]|uniref:FUSC family protein n=1 Tax=Arthrobacter sp. HY1533 TaxID=2970919 RepID=UPI0022B9DAD4|nr:FUSC family protein [Arthrobacter sp. HY1533]
MTKHSRLRHGGTALAHSVSGAAWRGSFTMRPADAIFAPAVKVGIAAALVLVAFGLAGQEQLAGIASLGALCSAFGRYQPYRRLAPMLAIVAVAMLAAVGIGGLLGAGGVPVEVQILVLSTIAALASHLFSAFRITGPGAVILVFAASAGAGHARTFDAVVPALAAMSIGAAAGWLVAMAPVLVAPMGPARLATARVIAAVARLDLPAPEGTDDGGARLGAARSALLGARESVAVSALPLQRSSRRTARLHGDAAGLQSLLDEAESALGLAEAQDGRLPQAVAQLKQHESRLRSLRRLPAAAAQGQPTGTAARRPAPPRFWAAARAGLSSRDSISQALRMAAASALSGWAAVALGLEHPLWASMGAVAALQGLNYGHTVQRGIQRLLGNVAGAVLAAALLSLSLGFWPSVALVIAFQVLAELLVLKNYTLTTIAVTPMALIMTGLGAHLGPEAAFSRVADTLVGVVIGVLVAAVSISLADRHHLPASR